MSDSDGQAIARRAPTDGADPGRRPPTGRIVLIGLAVIAVFFGVFGGWAAVAPLESAAIATGVVSVESNRKTVQHLEGGIVEDIRVREGEEVHAGQVLIRLDRTQAEATLVLLEGRRRALAARAARLVAERDGADAVEFPDWLTERSGDAEGREMLHGQLSIFKARREELAAQERILRQRKAQFTEEIRGLESQINAADRQLALIAEEITDVTSLVKKGLARKPRLLELQRRSAEIEGSRGRDVATIARAKQNIAEAELRVSELRVALVNQVVEELREVQTELFDIAQRVNAARDVLERTEIVAPLDGVIVGLRVHTAGGVIGPGEPLMDIVPSGDALIIEAQVDPADIDVVHSGLPAKVRLTAFPQRRVLPLDAEVVSVSADRVTRPDTGASYFLARIRLTEDPAVKLQGATLYPGMQAEVMIVTGARTALDYFIHPLVISLNRAFREK